MTVIATSRRPLHLGGEHEHPVPPLQLPSDQSLAEAQRSGAVRMFVEHVAQRPPRLHAHRRQRR